jgi:hypothetical protein
MPKPTVFLSYSHQDEIWKDRVSTRLRVLGELDIWDDRRIDLGATWRPEIQAALEGADVAVLLISADFLTSSFILEQEIPIREVEGSRWERQPRKSGATFVLPATERSDLYTATGSASAFGAVLGIPGLIPRKAIRSRLPSLSLERNSRPSLIWSATYSIS